VGYDSYISYFLHKMRVIFAQRYVLLSTYQSIS
jgi:hypothetical protein